MDFSLSLVLPQLFNGLVWGIVLGLLAIGLSIIFGMLNVINFCHGAMYAVGAYVAYSFIFVLTHFLGSRFDNFWIALVLAPVVVGAMGLGIEFFLLRPLSRLGYTPQVLVTFGLSLILQELIIIIWGSMPKSFPTPNLLKGVVNLGFMVYPKYRLFLLILTLLVILGIWIFLEKSRLGGIIRAGAEDAEMVSLVGINIQRLFTLIFGFGSAMAGFAGVLAGPVLANLQPDLGNSVVLACFVVVVLGGLGSFSGAVVGSIVVGIIKAVATMVWPPAATVIMFVLMALILVVRPQGLLGKR